MNIRRTPIPVSFFSMAVGLLALANGWHVAVRLWGLPAGAADLMSFVGLAVWFTVLVLYAHKWLRHPAEARAELAHPVQSSFAALGGVSSLLASIALLPYARTPALVLFAVAAVVQLALGAWLHGRFWQGGLKPELVTAAVYLPSVGQNFVAGAAAAAFGWPQLGAWFFGAGLLSWLATESMIMGRAATQGPLPEALRPALGIQLAPPVVGGVTYMSLGSGTPDVFAQILLGYGLFQLLVLLRLLPWIRAQAFSPSYWGFSFGVAALPSFAMRMVERGAGGPLEWLAPVLFAAANLVIGTLAVKTVLLLVRGKLVPAAPLPAPVLAAATPSP